MASQALRNPIPPDRRKRFLTLIVVVTVMGAGLLVIPLLLTPQLALPPAFWLLAGLALIADARLFMPRHRRRGQATFPSVCLTFAILLAWGVIPAIAVQMAAVGVSAMRDREAFWPLFTVSQYILSFGAAGTVLLLVDLRPYPDQGALSPSQAVGVVAAAGAWFLVQYGIVALGLWLRYGLSWRVHWVSLLWEALTYAALLLLSPILVAAAAASPALVPLVMLPLYAVYRMGRLAEDLGAMVRRDPLTGLANRSALLTALREQMTIHADLTAHGAQTSSFGLLLLDLDRFKEVNDALGHQVGDRLLTEVGRRLRSVTRAEDVVARLGGDEFAVLAPRLSGVADARAVAGRIAAALGEPVRLDGLPLDVGSSVGVAVWPDHGQEAAELLRRADVAMYDAKQRVAPVSIYVPEADQHSPEQLALLADLRAALHADDGGGIEVHYQPQIAVASGEVVGVEALLRWRHPVRGMISPDQVIRVAEHTAVMRLLTLRIVDEVIAQLARWSRVGLELRASINVSIRDLHTAEVADRLAEQLRRYDVPPSSLQLEITEGALMADPRRVLATIAALERMGVVISLDDFGTGYSSMQHLRRMPLGEVKIDRSFVQGMAHDDDDAAIVGSVIELAGALGLRVVAEGVEDEATWRQLAAAGCHVAQGWFYARPMAPDELLSWLSGHQPVTAHGVPYPLPSGVRGAGAGAPPRHAAANGRDQDA